MMPDRYAPTRRGFLRSAGAAGLMAGTAGLSGCAAPAAQPGVAAQAARRGERLLIRGGCILSLDPAIGDFAVGDVLVEGSRIAAVGPRLEADAEILEAAGMIVMPGFVDTHRHMWQSPLRNILPDGLLSDYGRDITGAARAVYRPDDAQIGNLVSALGALDAGITTVLDWSHIGSSPEHTDAAIEGLRESGLRAVYGYSAGAPGPANRFPDDIRRLRKEHFASDDQLLTLAMAAGPSPAHWALARDVGAIISVHILNSIAQVADVLGPDVTCIHCTNLPAEAWRRLADSGARVSIAGPIEMQMNHGVPPIQEALDHGIRPSLSVDVETQQPSDFFTQMHSVFALQRMFALERQRAGDAGAPALLSVRDVVEFATIQGAIDNHLDRKVGSLTPGKEADIILLQTRAINVMPVNNAYGAVVLGMNTANVDTVLVGGEYRKRQGQLVGVDLDRVRARIEASRDFIIERTGWSQTILGGDREGA
jgi:5-methylthioadenosine/S-adenosylhomocysteine deaminase